MLIYHCLAELTLLFFPPTSLQGRGGARYLLFLPRTHVILLIDEIVNFMVHLS